MELSPEQQRAVEEQKQHCPFCKMVRGELQTQKVLDTDDFIAVLDINPGVPGHTILVPKEHYPILPLMPKEEQRKLGAIAAELSDALKKSMIVPTVYSFIASGAVAGQQSSHFIMHFLPSDEELFLIPDGTSEGRTKLETMFAKQQTPAKDDLITIISQNPELQKMIIEQPDELIKNLPAAPDLAKLFEGVDIHKLSAKLREGQQESATSMSDHALVAFINSKEKLRNLLVDDPQTLELAIQTQPKLASFFKGTTIAHVRERYLRGASNV